MSILKQKSKLEDIAFASIPLIMLSTHSSSYVIESFKEGDPLRIANSIIGTIAMFGFSYLIYKDRTNYNNK